jgi:hypothetical protein
MAVKFSCPKCGRRFTEWGAERLGFKCPKDENCPKDIAEDIELVRVGVAEDRMLRRPALRKGARRPVPYVAPSALSEDEVVVPDIEDIEAATEIEGEEPGEVESEEEEETFEPAVTEELSGEVETVVPIEVEDIEVLLVEPVVGLEEIEETNIEPWHG